AVAEGKAGSAPDISKGANGVMDLLRIHCTTVVVLIHHRHEPMWAEGELGQGRCPVTMVLFGAELLQLEADRVPVIEIVQSFQDEHVRIDNGLSRLSLYGFDIVHQVQIGKCQFPVRTEFLADLHIEIRSEEHTSELQSREN